MTCRRCINAPQPTLGKSSDLGVESERGKGRGVVSRRQGGEREGDSEEGDEEMRDEEEEEEEEEEWGGEGRRGKGKRYKNEEENKDNINSLHAEITNNLITVCGKII